MSTFKKILFWMLVPVIFYVLFEGARIILKSWFKVFGV